jgi:hypothetical protein
VSPTLDRPAARERSDRRVGVVALVAILALSAAMSAGPFLWTGRLYHDTLSHFAYYLDNLDSLYRFGEPAWWSPQLDYGFPTYFYALLGVVNAGKPAFVLVAGAVWLLGRLGVEIESMLPFYVVYFAVVVPILFQIGVWMVARRLFRSRTAVLYVSIVAAFSPGVVLNLSDPGVLEYTAYCLYFTAAYLHWIERPSPRSFGILCLAGGLVSLAPGQYALMTAIPWLPLLVAVSAACSRAARAALRGVRLWQWAAAAVLALVVAAPSLIAHRGQGDELKQYKLDGLEYRYEELKPGNPLEFLLISVPGIGFEWDRYDPSPDAPAPEFGVRALEPGAPGAFDYLGVLALPLAAVGLAMGRRSLRVPLFVMLVIATTVLALAGHSLLFSLLLAVPTPLRSMNHYGDLLYRGGGFLLLVFAAGLGVEVAERTRRARRRLPALLALSGVVTFATWICVGAPPQSVLGFGVAMLAANAVLLLWLRKARAPAFAWGLLGLALIDVSTLAFWHVRTVMFEAREGQAVAAESPAEDLAGKTQKPVLMRNLELLKDVEAHRLPAVGTFCRAHAYADSPTQADVSRAVDGRKEVRSIALPAQLAAEPALQPFLAAPADAGCAARVQVQSDYNEKRLRVSAAQPSLVFFRDTASRHWRATVDGEPAALYPAFGAFQAVVVPAGDVQVRLWFSPPGVGLALGVAYATLAALAVALPWRRADGSRPTQPAERS